MPASQAATERRNDKMTTHEPPKLKTTLNTPPKQATNPLQFVKVGPCSLYRSAQEQLEKVQEVKKIKQEIRDDPEDWQSNLDNWKSSRRKRQEHIIERVVEVKKLELEEHDRQRKRSKTFSEMMEERGNRGRKLSLSLAIYHEEDSNDLSDLGIGTSSGKSSISGDTHDDTHSVLSDRDSEIDKNHSDVDNGCTGENGNDVPAAEKSAFGNGFHKNHNHHEYDSATTATASSPEPEEYTYEGAIRGYVSRVSQNIPRSSLADLDAKLDEAKSKANGHSTGVKEEKPNSLPGVKVDILKRREIFEKASQKSLENKNNNNNNRLDLTSTKSIKERLSILEKQRSESASVDKSPKITNRLSGDISSIRERLSHLKKQSPERGNKAHREYNEEEAEDTVQPLRVKLSALEKYNSDASSPTITHESRRNGELTAKTIKDRLSSLDAIRSRDLEKRSVVKHNFRDQENRADASTPSERSSSPDSEYRVTRSSFHRSLDSLDADASSGPDTFERVQSLEELDYARRYTASSSSAEILNDTDREDSGIHTADVSCSVSQADEPIDEEIVQAGVVTEKQEVIQEEFPAEQVLPVVEKVEEKTPQVAAMIPRSREVVLTNAGTADTPSSGISANNSRPQTFVDTNLNTAISRSSRPVVYPNPRVPPRRSPPEIPKPKVLCARPTDLPVSLNSITQSPVSCKVDQEQTRGSQEPQFSPGASPRSASKIPTPLPRKTLICNKSSPTGSATSTVLSSPSSPKASAKSRGLLGKIHMPAEKSTSQSPSGSISKLPVPSPTSPRTPEASSCMSQKPYSFPPVTMTPSERRRTVVELCEKVVVPQGETPATSTVTPFITVERLGDNGNFDEEPIFPDEPKASVVLDAAPLDTSTPIQSEDPVEADQSNGMELLQKVVQTKIELIQEQAVKEAPIEPRHQEVKQEKKPERPTTLMLEMKNGVSTDNDIDFISPISTGSNIQTLNLSSDEELMSPLVYSLAPPTSIEPPKEKPPPPPVDLSDEENHPVELLKRLNSTRRIKKEIRSRRSDFLGIEGINDEELERELTLTKPPDMAAILAEERRIEQLHRRSYDTDSNYEQDSSHERDSGVELGQSEDWTKQSVSPDMSQHSRQSSEPFGASVTSSEDDEIGKKEREIIEVLEKEEQWRYGNTRQLNSDIGEKLANKLLELEEEKMQLERERATREAEETQRRQEQELLRKNEENIRKQDEIRKQREDEAKIKEEIEAQRAEEKRQEEHSRIQEKLRIQSEREEREKRSTDARRQEEMQGASEKSNGLENHSMTSAMCPQEEEFASREVLRVERELLQLEQEELKRQRSNLAYMEQKQQQLAEQLQEQWKSLQDVAHTSTHNSQPYKPQTPLNYRSSMPNLQLQDSQRRRPPPPPIPPAKPLRVVEQRQRDVTIRNSRIPSADSIPQQVDASLRSSVSTTNLASHGGQQMSRQTLQALSAAPRPRIVHGDQWVQRRKSDVPRGAHDFNYQHWLIQEAEQRRLNEKNNCSAVRKPHVTGTSVPYSAPSPRSDSKPLPDSIIHSLTQRVQSRAQEKPLSPRRRLEQVGASQEHLHAIQHQTSHHYAMQQLKVHQSPSAAETQEKMLSVSGKKKCSHCADELGRGAAMIIESLRLFYHMECFKCCVCHVRLGDGLMGTDVRVRNHKLHCHNCYSSDDGVKFSCV